MVEAELNRWEAKASKIKSAVLREQALASLKAKKFHAQGGSIYALYPGADPVAAVRFIVALQTISDYLDNLCDRAGVLAEAAFRQLHLAMLDAVDPERTISDYYHYYPVKEDQDYLRELVVTCRSQVSQVPSYNIVKDQIIQYVLWYSELQSLKHLDVSIRERRLKDWASNASAACPVPVFWWEFAAATGSTLGIFILYAMAVAKFDAAAEFPAVAACYFPWVAGLHILLDYLIDREEDRVMGDLNFTTYYEDLKQARRRLTYFIKQSREAGSRLSHPVFHITVIKGLLAMYLSDHKALSPDLAPVSHRLVKAGDARFYHKCCLLLRAIKRL